MLSAGLGIRPLNDREFKLFQSLIHKEAGIYLSEVKKALLVGRLSRRIRELGLDSFEAYYRQFLEQTLAPRWRADGDTGARPKHIRAWSAACSSGEEPVSLAMSLLHHFPASAGWTVEVLATDISTRVLDRARAAMWPIERAGQIPPPYLKRFMLRGTGDQRNKMKAGPEIRAAVRFQALNLHAETYAVGDAFDLIFCRNVLIYFNATSKEHVVSRLLGRLAEGGLLFLGHAESLTGMRDQPRAIIPTVYSRTPR